MSLNGLDDSKVLAAFVAVSAEPGGWLLLKYASRDEVELLSQGTGGITEVRAAIEGNEENSALYGFLKYRRRNVIIKYLPEDTSRLMQARVAVHFTAVCERFTPNDTGTKFEITKAEELRDSKLSAACSLHAASGSNTSSTSSLRRRRLGEIAEEDEEDQRETKRRSLNTNDEDDKASSSAAPRSPLNDDPVRLNSELASSPEGTKFSNASTSELPNFIGSDGRPPSPSASITSGRRMSSQTTRTELYSNYSSYGYSKPKVKLGPRPTFDPSRPQTAGNFKPVSSIPAGLKLFGKGGSAKKGRPSSISSGKDDSVSLLLVSPSPDGAQSTIEFPPAPATPFSTTEEVVRPNTSSGVSTASTIVAAKPTMSREKARLKKAMQLREKKKKMSMFPAPGLEVASGREQAEEGEAESAEKNSDDPTDVEGDEASEADEKRVTILQVEEKRNTVIKAKSANEGETPPVPGDHVSEMETTGRESLSRPESPVPASSEADESTKASSISEGTEETVQKLGDSRVEREPAAPENGERLNGGPEEVTPVEDAVQPREDEISSAQVLRMSQDPERMLLKPLTYIPPHKESPIAEGPLSQTASDPVDSERSNLKEDAVEDHIADDVPASEEMAALYVQDATLAMLESNPLGTAPEESEEQPSETGDVPLRSPFRSIAEAPAPETSQDSTTSTPAIVATNTEDSEQEKLKARRRGFPEPIRTNIATRHSRHTSTTSTDDAFLDELQSAEVQEAKPMYVTKTPVTPVFPKEVTTPQPPPVPIDPNTEFFKPQVVRTTSNPLRGGLVVPTDVSQSSARSVSMGAAYLHKVTQQQSNGNLSKKGGKMGSGITQRIKALEMLSAKTDAEGQAGGSRPSSAFFSVNKSREPSRSPSVVDRANSLKRPTPEPTDQQLRNPSPETLARRRERTGSVVGRMSMFESSPGADARAYDYPQQTQRGRPESVSVTARIVRDPNNLGDPRSDGTELRQSPLQVDHHAAIPADEDYPRRMSRESRRSASQDGSNAKSRRSSLSVVKDFIKDRRGPANTPSGTRSPTATSQLSGNAASFSQRLSISKDRDTFSSFTEGSMSSDDTKSMSEKKTSRTTRFMRRLSTLSSKNNKTEGSAPGMSPPLTEEPEPSFHPMLSTLAQRPATTAGTPSITHQLGAANVQFPDTLLWKRRDLSLDSAGYLILAPLPGAAQSGKILGQSTKRFHMSMFLRPYIPDVEVEELPNSVVLDFKGGEGEGEGVKIAWEDRGGQIKFLQILEDAHASHTSRLGL